MALTGVQIQTFYDSVYMPLVGAVSTQPYIIKKIDGLGPPEADVSIARAVNAISSYQGRRPRDREMIFQIGLNPNFAANQSVASLRDFFYRLMTTDTAVRVTLLMADDGSFLQPDRSALGYVRRVEIVPFSKEPEVQITVSCLSPYFEATPGVTLSGSTFLAASSTITYRASVETGFYVEFVLNESRPHLYLSSTLYTLSDSYLTAKYMQIDYAFVAGDIIRIDSRLGQRSIQVKRIPNTWFDDITAALSPSSVWPAISYGRLQLGVGCTHVSYPTTSYTWNELTYTEQYWGV